MGPANPETTQVAPGEMQEVSASKTAEESAPAHAVDVVDAEKGVTGAKLAPCPSEHLVWGVLDLFTPKVFLGAIILQSLVRAFSQALFFKAALAPPQAKMLLYVIAGLLQGGSNVIKAAYVTWYMSQIHGGLPMWLMHCFNVAAFIVSFLEVVVLKSNKWGLLVMLAVVWVPFLLLPGPRRLFAFKWSMMRIVFQLCSLVGLQNLPALQAKLPPALKPLVFPLGAFIYKTVCTPCLMWLWKYTLGQGRGAAPVFPFVMILACVRYSSEALFLSGIIFNFVMAPETAVQASILNIVYHNIMVLLTRFGLLDAVVYRLKALCKKDAKPDRDYMKEMVFRVAATQSWCMWYMYATMAVTLLAFNVVGLPPPMYKFLANPNLWITLLVVAGFAFIVEMLVGAFTFQMRKQHPREPVALLALCTGLHRGDANVGCFTSSPAWQEALVAARQHEIEEVSKGEEMKDFKCVGWQLMGLLFAIDTATAITAGTMSGVFGKVLAVILSKAAAGGPP